MKIVITGALGHIGSRLIRELPVLFDDLEIAMIDHLGAQRYSSLFNLPQEGKYRFYEADILEADLEHMFSGADVVIHLAAITDATNSFDNKELVERVNYVGTERVARACCACGCPLIFPSTTSVYGTQNDVVDESCGKDELQPQSPYAESKLKAEDLLVTIGEQEGLRFIACRLGTIFGSSLGMRFHTAVNKFCWQAVMGQPITVWRTAMDQNRPYLDLRDAVRAMEFIIRQDLFDARVYNIVTLNTSVRAIIESISTYIPDVTVEYVDTKIMNQLSYHVENKRIKEKGFEFIGVLDDGVRDTIELLRRARLS